jgi:hypothetical protein
MMKLPVTFRNFANAPKKKLPSLPIDEDRENLMYFMGAQTQSAGYKT